MIRRGVAAVALVAILLQLHAAANACGPSYLQPIFVSETSPDLPFIEFAAGNIGIVQPGFGRKTLLIAYRYLNGGSFNAEEQQALVSALKGSAPDEEGEQAIKAWIELRKQITPEEDLPEIYRERTSPFSGYDYFPNCAKNAFEVATATLKDRIASYGADDASVREWIHGQDQVFENCGGSAPSIPTALAGGVPVWLRKDRDYQIAAALFYSLQYEQALAGFEKIAEDAESNWQSTAEYLIARTLVRQASLTSDKLVKAALYARAENQLAKLSGGNNQFAAASRKLLGLIKYRTQPEARLVELAELVTREGASLDLRQDVIDYVWLLDKFEGEVLKSEHERQEALKNKERGEPDKPTVQRMVSNEPRDDEITVTVAPKLADGTRDYQNVITVQVKFDTPEAEVFRLLEERLHRQLTDEEKKGVQERVSWSLEYRKWRVSYNRKLTAVATANEACYYCYDIKLRLPQLPAFVVASDLSDWIFTMQLEGPETYEHAFTRWRDSESQAWLVAALAKAQVESPDITRLMRAAQRITSYSPAFPTVAFNLARLNLALGRTKTAQDILNQVQSQIDRLPLSAQNQFQKQRTGLSGSVGEFLKLAARRPVAFYDEGLFASMRDVVESKKEYWADYQLEESKEDYEKRVETEYRDLLSDDLRLFDEDTDDVINRHFSLRLLQQAARDPHLSKYLRERLMIMVFTRALLLKNQDVVAQVAPDVSSVFPEMTPLLERYIRAKGAAAQERAALFLLLKSPSLTPFISSNSIQFTVFQDLDYYFESAWWCAASETGFNRAGEEVKKNVPAPAFIDRQELSAAKRDYDELRAIGDAKSYLGQKAIEWAKTSPADPRIPEALFIAIKANENYKYGCGGWEHDDEIREEATKLLRERYPHSAWTAKLDSSTNR